jgi:hypothetical protein
VSLSDDWEVEWVQQREAEGAAERDRLTAQKARTDLTPLDPAPGEWTVESHWRQNGQYARTTLRTSRVDREEAHRDGLQLSCCAGITAIRVIAPGGRVVESYDREGNYWLCHDWPRAAGEVTG